MEIRRRLFEIVSSLALSDEDFEDIVVENVICGLCYTAILMRSSSTGRKMVGVSQTMREEMMEGCSLLDKAGSLFRYKPVELMRMHDSLDILEVSISQATMNAYLNHTYTRLGKSLHESGDAMGMIDPSLLEEQGKKVGLVGYIHPIAVALHERYGCQVYIFEKNAQVRERIRLKTSKYERMTIIDAKETQKTLRTLTYAFVTSTTITNGTLDSLLLDLSDSKVILIGPTTPLAPECFEGTPVIGLAATYLGEDSAESACHIVSEGGGTSALHKVGRKILASL